MRLFLFSAFLISSVIAQPNLNHRISELKLRDGRVLEDVQVTGFASAAVIARWNGGRGTIPYELFPAEYESVLSSIRPAGKQTGPRVAAISPTPSRTIPSAPPQSGPAESTPSRSSDEKATDIPPTPVGKPDVIGTASIGPGTTDAVQPAAPAHLEPPPAMPATKPGREHVSGDAAWGATRVWIIGTVIVGSTLSVSFLWLLWRGKPSATVSMAAMQKVWDAASGLPSVDEIRVWPLDHQRNVIAGFAESDGYWVEPEGEDQLLLRNGPAKSPSILVQCLPIERGRIEAEKLNEFSSLLRTRGIPRGWLVAPGGFSPKARAAAALHPNILPVDDEAALELLRAVPPALLGKVLGRN